VRRGTDRQNQGESDGEMERNFYLNMTTSGPAGEQVDTVSWSEGVEKVHGIDTCTMCGYKVVLELKFLLSSEDRNIYAVILPIPSTRPLRKVCQRLRSMPIKSERSSSKGVK
jgi:hypothetical protein